MTCLVVKWSTPRITCSKHLPCRDINLCVVVAVIEREKSAGGGGLPQRWIRVVPGLLQQRRDSVDVICNAFREGGCMMDGV